MRRRRQKTQSRLPLTLDPRNLFHTPGAGGSNPPEANRVTTPGAPVQARTMEPPRINAAPPHYIATPRGHFSNPMENLIAASARLAALPMEGDSPAAIETRRVRELLQTALAQQDAYSYSRDRIHSTPCPSRSPSYSRHMESAEMSSNAQRHNWPYRYEPVRAGALNLADQERIRQEAEWAAQIAAEQAAHQTFPDYPATSVEAGVATRIEVYLAWSQPYAMSGCPRISRDLVRCLTTRLTYSRGLGLRVMRWLWSYWRLVILQWPNILPSCWMERLGPG